MKIIMKAAFKLTAFFFSDLSSFCLKHQDRFNASVIHSVTYHCNIFSDFRSCPYSGESHFLDNQPTTCITMTTKGQSKQMTQLLSVNITSGNCTDDNNSLKLNLTLGQGHSCSQLDRMLYTNQHPGTESCDLTHRLVPCKVISQGGMGPVCVVTCLCDPNQAQCDISVLQAMSLGTDADFTVCDVTLVH